MYESRLSYSADNAAMVDHCRFGYWEELPEEIAIIMLRPSPEHWVIRLAP